MDGILQTFNNFPAIWAIIGGVCTGVATAIVGVKFAPMYNREIKSYSVLHEQMVSAFREQIDELKLEKADYKDKLHSEKEAHNGTMQKLTLLEARPNVEQIYTSQQGFFTKMISVMGEQEKTMQAIQKTIIDHDRGVEARTGRMIDQMITRMECRDK